MTFFSFNTPISSSVEDTSDEAYERRHALMEIQEYNKLMPLVNPKLFNNKKEVKQKQKKDLTAEDNIFVVERAQREHCVPERLTAKILKQTK